MKAEFTGASMRWIVLRSAVETALNRECLAASDDYTPVCKMRSEQRCAAFEDVLKLMNELENQDYSVEFDLGA